MTRAAGAAVAALALMQGLVIGARRTDLRRGLLRAVGALAAGRLSTTIRRWSPGSSRPSTRAVRRRRIRRARAVLADGRGAAGAGRSGSAGGCSTTRDAAAAAALIFVGAPLIAGAPLATPDTPLVFFWTLALLGLVEVWRGRNWAWALVGLAAGAAGLAKLTAGFLGARRRAGAGRDALAAPAMAAAGAVAGGGAGAWPSLSPFLIWNVDAWLRDAAQAGRAGRRRALRAALSRRVPRRAARAVQPAERRRRLARGVARRARALRSRRGCCWRPSPRRSPISCFTRCTTACRATGRRRSIPRWRSLAGAGAVRRLRWPAARRRGAGLAAVAAAYLHLALAWPRLRARRSRRCASAAGASSRREVFAARAAQGRFRARARATPRRRCCRSTARGRAGRRGRRAGALESSGRRSMPAGQASRSAGRASPTDADAPLRARDAAGRGAGSAGWSWRTMGCSRWRGCGEGDDSEAVPHALVAKAPEPKVCPGRVTRSV